MSFAGDSATYAPNQAGTGVIPADASLVGPGGGSLAHGWAGGPVPALSGYVLGIRPVTPGFATWVVEPQVGDLRFAQGQAPTPHGPVVSRWERGEGSFSLTAGGPAGPTGSVGVPLPGHDRTRGRDGVLVRPAAVAGDYARFDRVSGVHPWTWPAAAARTCASRRSIVVHLRRG